MWSGIKDVGKDTPSSKGKIFKVTAARTSSSVGTYLAASNQIGSRSYAVIEEEEEKGDEESNRRPDLTHRKRQKASECT